MGKSKREKELIEKIVGDSLIVIDLYLKTNVFLLRGENNKWIMVDTGTFGDEHKIIKAMKEKANITPNDLSLILITHAHFDHAGSAHYFKQTYPHIPIAVPELEAEWLKTGEKYPSTPAGLSGKILNIRGNSFPIPKFEPDILLKGRERLEEYGVKASVLHTPGHTIGDMTVLLDNGVAIVNDLMGGGLIKYGNPDYHFFYEDRNEILRQVSKLLFETNAQVFFVTHGFAFTKEPALKWFQKQKMD
ncbi:hypothetical protein ABK040_006067 [Willaertia magna]